MADGSVLLERRKESPAGAGHYHVTDTYPHRVDVRIGGRNVASSRAAKVLKEAGRSLYDPSFYLPAEDVALELFEREEGFTTHCPVKGEASYWRYVGGPQPIERAAWSYEEPLPYSGVIAGHLGFDQRFATLVLVSRAEEAGETGEAH